LRQQAQRLSPRGDRGGLGDAGLRGCAFGLGGVGLGAEPGRQVGLASLEGGLLDGEGRVIDSINLSTEYEHLMQQDWLHSGMKVKIEQIHDLLMQLPPSSSVSITKPDELAKELFTHRGSGTLVRRGEKIHSKKSFKGLDLKRLQALIESSFGRKLVKNYFDTVKPYRIYVSEHYRAALILTIENGIPHLDKFAVSDDAQAARGYMGHDDFEVVENTLVRRFPD
jgi:acetylglutamate kinase